MAIWPRNLLGEWSRLFVGSLTASGVRDVVVSPGSRSTPLVCALLEQTDIRVTSALDERSAGFFALGLARQSGRAPLLVCTSGSAGAHYYPAVVEAAESRLPLLVVTANRPGELQDCAAAQTIDQTRLFGRFARGFFALGEPQPLEDALRGLRRKACQGWALAHGPEAGPVHFDFPARKPLEPHPAETADELWLSERVTTLLAGVPRVHGARLEPSSEALDELARQWQGAARPLVLLGATDAASAESVARLVEHTGAAWLAETAGHAPSAAPAQTMLDRFGERLPAPDWIVRFGPPLTAASAPGYQARVAAPLAVVTPYGYPDPEGDAVLVVQGEVGAVAEALLARLSQSTERPEATAWKQEWSAAARRVDEALGALLTDSAPWSEQVAIDAALSRLPAGAQLCLGNSLPLRWADAVRRHALGDRVVRTFVQRGANGIDGLLAGAAGVALGSEAPTLLVVGDVTAAHDLSSLALAREASVPLCILVVDNDGGHIFDQLPLATRGEELGAGWKFWSTPPRLDFGAAAAAYGVDFAVARSRFELESAVDQALRRPGTTLVHAPVEARAAWAFRQALERQLA
ncbi:MAG TPA: 2-succinyl-5-enolpyruvyl-6-hydroxy-3-cyclohexene-1-carboxylic-acid synthase [Polyangiaceae bacterium]|nr:2-succinyl-5-enolpyruvyl-6-hydroxy-3-cyclohexene-1-carboxylic-acid synthase [Polyangiaceae bacterium]